jgi:hypothetical protein
VPALKLLLLGLMVLGVGAVVFRLTDSEAE